MVRRSSRFQSVVTSATYQMRPSEIKPHTAPEAPELWRKHARQPWRLLFPDLDWPLPEEEE